MQITPPANSLVPTVLSDAGAPDAAQAGAASRQRAGKVAREGAGTVPTPDAVAQPGESATVHLSAAAQAGATAHDLAPVYAEIWKDGVKVAVIDNTGGVRSVNGGVPGLTGNAGNGGTLLAARRAAEIAGAIGGEIRVDGATLDHRTLAMRERLARAYGG